MKINRSRHAYLIMAHSDPTQLQNLVSAIDDKRNDIYIHIDGKTDISIFKSITSILSPIKFIENRIDVFWGDSSQIYAEYKLLNCVNGGKYSRIHLLSGADYPLKGQDYIHNFFDSHESEEFISFEDECKIKSELRKKMRLYNLFLKQTSHHNQYIASLFSFSRRVMLVLQMAIGINRHYSFDTIKKGSNWVSITQKFADELLKNEQLIKKEYRLTHCSDEIYKQTIAWSCGFKDRISPLGNLRMIDFKRGNRKSPYTFKESDFEEIKNSPFLFARKFSTSLSGNLVSRLKGFIDRKSHMV